MKFSHAIRNTGAALSIACCAIACHETYNRPADGLLSEKIVADYVRKEMKGKPYTLYLYTDTNAYHLRLADDDRSMESGPSYVYFLDQEPGSPWPHPCQSIWIDRADGTFSVRRGETPLRGEGKWLLVNNLWDEDPRTGMGECLPLSHPDHVVKPCLYYKFEGDDLKMEHQCLPIPSSTAELSLRIDQSDHRLVIVAEDPQATAEEGTCLKHYGCRFHLDSLHVPLDSLTTRRLESIPVDYRANTGGTHVRKTFILPTSGRGKIAL